MNNQIVYFCELIKSVIHSNEELELNNDVNWTMLVKMAKEHNILPIFLEGAIKYEGYTIRHEYDKELKETLAVVGAQVRRTNAFLQLYVAFSQAGIYPIVMKGLICRSLYGNLADHRPSGDEDILIQQREYWQAKKVLVANGYVPEFENETETQLAQIQEISFYHPTKKLHLELHLNTMGRENDTRTQMSDCFKHVFEDYRVVEINGVKLRTMKHEDHLLYLILHAFRHFTSGGFGVRQMLDILLYLEQYGSQIDMNKVYDVLKRFKADIYFSDMLHIGNTYLGFKHSTIQEKNCPDELLDDMILSGTFGNRTQAERTAVATTMSVTEYYGKKKNSNYLVLIWKSIFPSLKMMEERHPYLTDKPWLLPFEWVKRWGRYIRYNRKVEGSLAVESLKISQRRMNLLKKYDLI